MTGTGQLDPLRALPGRLAGVVLTGAEATLEGHALLRRHGHEGMLTVVGQRLTDHHASLGPGVGIRDALDPAMISPSPVRLA